MLTEIENPLATAVVTWIPPEEGGRRSGPPTALVYSATAAFRLAEETEEVHPGWPATAEQVSILLQRISQPPAATELVKVGFLFPELATPYIYPGVAFVVLEGPRIVATGVIEELCQHESVDGGSGIR